MIWPKLQHFWFREFMVIVKWWHKVAFIVPYPYLQASLYPYDVQTCVSIHIHIFIYDPKSFPTLPNPNPLYPLLFFSLHFFKYFQKLLKYDHPKNSIGYNTISMHTDFYLLSSFSLQKHADLIYGPKLLYDPFLFYEYGHKEYQPY